MEIIKQLKETYRERLPVKCEKSFNSYFDLIAKNYNILHNSYTERHHILPKASDMFPELAKDETNIVRLSAYDHFLAHYYIAKFAKTRSSIFALNNMNRVKKRIKDESMLNEMAIMYAEFRVDLVKVISESNTGRVWSDEARTRASLVHTGHVVVRDSNGVAFRTTIDDPRYISGELVPAQTGSKRSVETRALQSKKASIEYRGTVYYNKVTGELAYFKEAPPGWVAGYSETHCEKFRDAQTDNLFWYNEKTGEQVRSKEKPDGDWTNKRVWDNPFSGSTIIKNIYTLETKRVNIDSRYDEPRWIPNGGKPIIFEVDGTKYVHYDRAVIANVLGMTPKFFDLWVYKSSRENERDKLITNVTLRPHPTMRKYFGMKYTDIPVILHDLDTGGVDKEISWWNG